MIKTRVAKEIGATIMKSNKSARQADGITLLAVVGEIHLIVSRGHQKLQLHALVVALMTSM